MKFSNNQNVVLVKIKSTKGEKKQRGEGGEGKWGKKKRGKRFLCGSTRFVARADPTEVPQGGEPLALLVWALNPTPAAPKDKSQKKMYPKEDERGRDERGRGDRGGPRGVSKGVTNNK